VINFFISYFGIAAIGASLVSSVAAGFVYKAAIRHKHAHQSYRLARTWH
jgi:hypothetical protein